MEHAFFAHYACLGSDLGVQVTLTGNEDDNERRLRDSMSPNAERKGRAISCVKNKSHLRLIGCVFCPGLIVEAMRNNCVTRVPLTVLPSSKTFERTSEEADFDPRWALGPWGLSLSRIRAL